MCKKKNILAVDQAEFLSLCQLVETRGILKVQGRKEARLCRVSVVHIKLFYTQNIGSKILNG
jgi:cell division control protein 6